MRILVGLVVIVLGFFALPWVVARTRCSATAKRHVIAALVTAAACVYLWWGAAEAVSYLFQVPQPAQFDSTVLAQGNVTVGKAATGLTVSLGTGVTSASSSAQLMDDIGSATVDSVRRLIRVSNGAGTSYDLFQRRNAFDDNDGTTFPASRADIYECNLGLTSPATWVTTMEVRGGDSNNPCNLVFGDATYNSNSTILLGANSFLNLADNASIVADEGAGAAWIAPPGVGDIRFDAIDSANEFCWDGDSDDECDVTLDDADVGADGSFYFNGDDLSGPWIGRVSGNTAANDCGTCDAARGGARCWDDDGDGSTACTGGVECRDFLCDGTTWVGRYP